MVCNQAKHFLINMRNVEMLQQIRQNELHIVSLDTFDIS